MKVETTTNIRVENADLLTCVHDTSVSLLITPIYRGIIEFAIEFEPRHLPELIQLVAELEFLRDREAAREAA